MGLFLEKKNTARCASHQARRILEITKNTQGSAVKCEDILALGLDFRKNAFETYATALCRHVSVQQCCFVPCQYTVQGGAYFWSSDLMLNNFLPSCASLHQTIKHVLPLSGCGTFTAGCVVQTAKLKNDGLSRYFATNSIFSCFSHTETKIGNRLKAGSLRREW